MRQWFFSDCGIQTGLFAGLWAYFVIANFGAPCQCQYPYFCLVFVHCPHFVLLLSRFCLTFVPFLSSVPLLSSSCLHKLSFVLIWTSFCLLWSQKCPAFVLIWSPQSMTNGEDKYWTKLGLNNFSFFYLVTLQLDKKWTILGHESQICPLFVQAHIHSICTSTSRYLIVGQTLDKS